MIEDKEFERQLKAYADALIESKRLLARSTQRLNSAKRALAVGLVIAVAGNIVQVVAYVVRSNQRQAYVETLQAQISAISTNSIKLEETK